MQTEKSYDEIIEGRLRAARENLKDAMELILDAYTDEKTASMLMLIKKNGHKVPKGPKNLGTSKNTWI